MIKDRYHSCDNGTVADVDSVNRFILKSRNICIKAGKYDYTRAW